MSEPRSVAFKQILDFSFISSFVRSNLIYSVLQKSSGLFYKTVEELVRKFPRGSGIIYCLSR